MCYDNNKINKEAGRGYVDYDGTAVRVNEPLPINQKVIVIPVENEMEWEESAAGVLHQYANTSLIEQEKDAWRKAVVEKHGRK